MFRHAATRSARSRAPEGSARPRTRVAVSAVVALLAVLLAACIPADVQRLASDEFQGRDALTLGGGRARAHIVGQLKRSAIGAVPGQRGDAAYLQLFSGGVNIVGIVPGTTKPGEYVVFGAHYDHKGSNCSTAVPADRICNGATDNATGVAAALEVAHQLARDPAPRSVVIAFWDAEEDGILGSKHYVAHPLVPLAETVAYVNLDILGANLAPSLRDHVFAVAGESGGSPLTGAVASATSSGDLTVTALSEIFSQGRSDHARFTAAKVPSVFVTDSGGPCYHTAQDDVDVVDLPKLDRETALVGRLVRTLATQSARPAFVANRPVATFADAVAFREVLETSWVDVGRFSAASRARLEAARATLTRIVTEGVAAFDANDVADLLRATATANDQLQNIPCDGYLAGG